MIADKVKASLEKCVARGQCEFWTYGEFGKRYGLGNHARAWANKNTLDTVAAACKNDPNIGLDLTFLIRNGRTKYPSVIDGRLSKPPSAAQKARAKEEAQKIIDRFAPTTANPYTA